jgi:hypothetical protein
MAKKRALPLLTMMVMLSGGTVFGGETVDQSFHRINVSISEIYSIGVNGGNARLLITEKDVVAGEAPASKEGQAHLQYTIVTGSSASIQAALSQPLPPGLKITILAIPSQGRGEGKPGTSTGPVELTTQPKPIISDIRSCYTGSGMSDGAVVTYKLTVDGRVTAQMPKNYEIVFTARRY